MRQTYVEPVFFLFFRNCRLGKMHQFKQGKIFLISRFIYVHCAEHTVYIKKAFECCSIRIIIFECIERERNRRRKWFSPLFLTYLKSFNSVCLQLNYSNIFHIYERFSFKICQPTIILKFPGFWKNFCFFCEDVGNIQIKKHQKFAEK